MKAVLFLHVSYLIFIKSFMVKGTEKCGSQVEMRAVLLTCPLRENSCDENDLLSQTMDAEQKQLLQAKSKKVHKDTKAHEFPNAVKDCKRKLVITMRVKNVGKVPCDDKYIVVDHVYDPITGGKARLLSPMVLKLRQEQMVQLYGLQFQNVVNNDPYEEQISGNKVCSVNPNNPTCGITMYDGKPIPFSEGFCCSCSSHINAKRQLSPVSHGDSFIYRDSKLISQGHSHLTREDERTSFTDPGLVQQRKKKEDEEQDQDQEQTQEQEYLKQLNSDKIPNYLLEKDRKIVCDKGDFMDELCNLRDEKMKLGMEGSEKQGPTRGPVSEAHVSEKSKTPPKKAKSKISKLKKLSAAAQASFRKKPKSAFMLHDGIQMINGESKVRRESKGNRGKRENKSELKRNTLEENLSKFLKTKKISHKNRRKRLLEISHKRNLKKERCTAPKCEVPPGPDFPDLDYVKPQPPVFFFCHDKIVLNPLSTNRANGTGRTPIESAYEGLKYALQQSNLDSKFEKPKKKKCHQKLKGKMPKDHTYTISEEMLMQNNATNDNTTTIIGTKNGKNGKNGKKNKNKNKNEGSEKKGNTKKAQKVKGHHENSAQNKEKQNLKGSHQREDNENYFPNEKMRGEDGPNFSSYYLSKTNGFLNNNQIPNSVSDEEERKDGMKGFSELSKNMKEENPGNDFEPPLKEQYKLENSKTDTRNPEDTALKVSNSDEKAKQDNEDRKFISIIKEPYRGVPNSEKLDSQGYDFTIQIARPVGPKSRFGHENPDELILNPPEIPGIYFTPNGIYNRVPNYFYYDQGQPVLPPEMAVGRTKNGLVDVRNPYYYPREFHRVPINPERRFPGYYRKQPNYFDPYAQYLEMPDVRVRPFQDNYEKYKDKEDVEYTRKTQDRQENPEEESTEEKIRQRRSVEFEPAKGYFASDSKPGTKFIPHELDTCSIEDAKKPPDVAPIDINAEILTRLPKLREKITKRDRKAERSPKSDLERLIQSYLTAPDYVLSQLGVEKEESNDQTRNCNCGKSLEGEYTHDTAHCMRFGDLWYNVYNIKKPMVAQIVGVQLFDKQTLHDGRTRWKDLTKGKMIRLGTFLTSAEDDLPSVSLTFSGEDSDTLYSPIDPEKYFLLVPSHLTDSSKASLYPQLDGGPGEYLLINKNELTSGGECNKIGTSFEAFARQPGRCVLSRGSCLKRQPVDLWREDMEARIQGKRGKYFVENFGTVPNSNIKSYTNLTGEYLAVEYYGDYSSTIEIEVKADHNLLVRKGRSTAQIPTVFVDGSYPKKTRIVMSVLNTGLTSSNFRPRLGDCSPDLDPSWCPLEGPSVTIPPQKRHDFKLDLSGPLPPNKLHATVQVLNQDNLPVAQRKIRMKRGERCMCAFHCRCNCMGDPSQGKTCRKMTEDDYRAAGYVGLPPFRAGPFIPNGFFANLRLVFYTSSYVLLMFGVMKGVLGAYFRPIGISGVRIVTGPRRLSRYFEPEIECCTVLYDEFGFPIHPTTCQPVQIVPLFWEIVINIFFFFLYPIRGFWLILKSCICVKLVLDEGDNPPQDNDNKCSSPLLSQHTCVNYNLTTITSKKCHADEFLPYLPYRGDNDPLEEDDTEFVLQEMERHKQK